MEQAAPAAFAGILVIPILAIFFLSDGEKLADQIIHLVATKENHGTLESLAGELHVMLQRYIRAKVILGGLSLLYCSIAMLVAGLSERDSAGHSGRNTGIHSGCRLDHRSSNDRHCGSPHSLALDMDACATRCLANFDGLWHFAACHGTRTRNSPFARNFHINGGRRSGWNRGDLSFGAAGRCLAGHLPKVRMASGGYDTPGQLSPQSGPEGRKIRSRLNTAVNVASKS